MYCFISTCYHIPQYFLSSNEGRECVPYGRGMESIIAQFYYYLTFFINFSFPFTLLLSLNSVIIHTLRKRAIPNADSQNKGQCPASKIKSSERQIFLMLLSISFAFLVLTTPGYVMILYIMFVDYKKSPKSFSEYYLFYNVGQKTYYTNCGINFFIYVISGQKFRADVIKLFRCNRKSPKENSSSLSSDVITQRSSVYTLGKM